MTTPGDAFEYNDDSVVARVSFEVPGQALNDIGQLTQAMAAMRTQLEAISRSQSDWLEYLREIPEITEQANEALRSQITLLERASYIQNEIGGGNLVGGGAGYGGSGPGAPGGGGYSTAAPAGYVNPWGTGTPGLGMGGMGGGNGGASVEAAAGRMAQIEAEDPRLAANMDAQRGRAINPALMTALGMATSKVMGKLSKKPRDEGATKPGQSAERDSDAVADGDMGGTPATANNPNSPGEPHATSSILEKGSYYLAKGQQLFNEMAGDKQGRMGSILRNVGKAMGAGSQVLGGGDAGGAAAGGGGGIGGILGSAASLFGKLPPGMQATAGIGAGLLAFNKAQDLGEKYTQFQQLGSVQGGDAMTGMKYEAQARLMALNPFITTQQARQAMQMALKEGFRGDNYDTVQDFMVQNFKDLGISMGQSMELMKAQAKGMSEGDDQTGIAKDLTETLNTMKELSAEGGASFPKRAEQLQDLTEVLKGKGYSSDSINRSAIALQEGYGDNLALRDSIAGINAQVADSDMLNILAGQQVGITGRLPGVTGKALNDAGYDSDEIMLLAARHVAGYASSFPDKVDRIGQFMILMGQYGVQLDYNQAEGLYDKVTGEESPVEKANNVVARQGKTQTKGSDNVTSSNLADANWNSHHNNYSPSANAGGVSDSFEEAGRGSANFAPSGNAAPALPTAGMAMPASLTSTGSVTGTLTVVVDSQGRVTAPPSIQLTGTQKAAYAGFSSSQVNNHSPGDPNYNHSMPSFPGGR